MSTASLLLVVISCVLHAWWNFVLKRCGASQTFVGLSKVAEAILFLPAFAWFFDIGRLRLRDFLLLTITGAAITGANYVLLAKAYKSGDLAFVYPLSRGGILLFLPFLAYLFTGTAITALGACGLVIILGGMALLVRSQKVLSTALGQNRGAATFLALAAAFTAACYTLWDRHSVRQVQPFLYLYAYTFFIAMGWLPSLLAERGIVAIEWRRHRLQIVQVGILNIITYCLVLLALKDSNPTYVVAMRQLSVAAGAVLGWWLLKEPRTTGALLAVMLLVAGCALTAIA